MEVQINQNNPGGPDVKFRCVPFYVLWPTRKHSIPDVWSNCAEQTVHGAAALVSVAHDLCNIVL